MTTTTRNGQISRGITTKRRVNKPPKNDKINYLNEILGEIVKLKGWKNTREACKKIGIPVNGGKVTSKQLPGYIGMAKQYLRECKK